MGRIRALTYQFSRARAAYGSDFSEEQLESLRSIFQQLDPDGNGTLELVDIESYMTSVGWPVPDELQEEFSRFDKDSSGSLDVEEFLDLMVWAASTNLETPDRGSADGERPPLEDPGGEGEYEDGRRGEAAGRLKRRSETSLSHEKWLYQELERASEQLEEAAGQQDSLRGQLAARTAELQAARRDLRDAQVLLDDRRAAEARGVSAALDALRAAIARCEDEKRGLAAAADASALEQDRLARRCQALDRALAASAARQGLLRLFSGWRRAASPPPAPRPPASEPPSTGAARAAASGGGEEEAAACGQGPAAEAAAGPRERRPSLAEESGLDALQAAMRSLLPELTRLGALAECVAGSAPPPLAAPEAGGALHALTTRDQPDGSLCGEAALLRRECLRWQHLLSEHLRQRESPARGKAPFAVHVPGCCSCFSWLWMPSA